MSFQKIYDAFLGGAAICTDTRKLSPGCIFFALKGPSFDGNTFAQTAIEKGAAYAVCDNPEVDHPQVVQTEDVLAFLQQLARFHRQELSIPILAITGSNGKTTTKELLSRVLAKKYKLFATKGNLNNHIGVPLTLLSLSAQHEFAVVEMGANHQKEIELLCSIALPTHVLITNVGKAHLEGFGGFEGVKKGKGEMYAYARSRHAMVFINSGNAHLHEMLGDYGNVFTYSLTGNAMVTGDIVGTQELVSMDWKYQSDEVYHLHSQITGNYNAENILAAVAAGCHFGVKPQDINEAIGSYSPDNHRSQVMHQGSNTIVMDAYNANPTSMEAALLNFKRNYSRPAIVVLGEMLELGEEALAEHTKVVKLAEQLGFDEIILVGDGYTAINDGKHPHFQNAHLAADYIRAKAYSKSNLLFKGSRGAKMELAAAGLS